MKKRYSKYRKYTYLDALIDSSVVEKLSLVITIPMIVFIVYMIISN